MGPYSSVASMGGASMGSIRFEHDQEAEAFVLDNTLLKSETEGLFTFEDMEDDADRNSDDMVNWGHVFQAVDVDEDWVQLGEDRYFPKKMDGVVIVKHFRKKGHP